MNDVLVYEEGKIRITQNIFSNGRGDQYVVASIRDISEEHSGKSVLVLLIGTVLMAVAGWREFFEYSREIMGGVGALMVLKYFFTKERHSIVLITPGGEYEAFTTKDETQHKNILTCLKRAIALHQ